MPNELDGDKLKSKDEHELAQYLAELAVNNPQTLPLAMLKIMKHLLNDRMAEILETSWSQFEKELRRTFNSGSDDDKSNRP